MRHIIFLFFIVLFSFPLHAFDKLPEVQSMTMEGFEEQSIIITKEYEDDIDLNFTIHVPTNFIEKPFDRLKNENNRGNLLGEVFYAYGPAVGDIRPYVSVQSVIVKRAISAENWFKNEVLNNNFTVRGFDASKDNMFDAFYVRLDDFGRTEIVRSKGMLNKDRMVVVEYAIPMELWNVSSDQQILTVQSFEFLKDYGVKIPEGLHIYSFLDSFQFQYPKSWRFVEAKTSAVNQIDVSLLTVDVHNFVFGHMDITTISEQSLKDRIDKTVYPIDIAQIVNDMKDKLVSEKKFETANVIERRDYDLNFDTTLSLTEVYALRKKKADTYVIERQNEATRELWLSVIKSDKFNKQNYILAMNIPSRDKNFYQWAVSVEAYETVLETLR
jgi:hypothetical protein